MIMIIIIIIMKIITITTIMIIMIMMMMMVIMIMIMLMIMMTIMIMIIIMMIIVIMIIMITTITTTITTTTISITITMITIKLVTNFQLNGLSENRPSKALWLGRWMHPPTPIFVTHSNDVLMSTMASQITGVPIVRSTVASGADQRKRQSSASRAVVRGIHRWPMNSPQKGQWKYFHMMTSSWHCLVWSSHSKLRSW